MAKQTGQITVVKNNTVTNVEHQIRFIFVKQNGERITRDTSAKGVINFDIPNGDWNVSWFAVKGDQKVLPLRAGLQLKITSSTPPTALSDWIYGDNTHVADPILTQWTEVLDEMKAVRDKFRDETQSIGNGKFMKEGAYGVGTIGNAPNLSIEYDISERLPNGFYKVAGGSTGFPSWKASGDSLISSGWGASYWSSLHLSTDNRLAMISSRSGVISEWAEFYSTSNTTVDSNGNIKAASPIVKLFANKIEHSGFGDEKPVFEKLDTGIYKISNTLGLAKGEYDGDWYIETPKDKNGDVLFNIEWSQDEDNNVIIRTYKRREIYKIVEDEEGNIMFGEKRGILNGDPVDINDGRFVSLRFYEDPEVLEAEIARQEAEMLAEE
ncbi:hypothetical protein MMG00_12300 [Ignatzschineria rhizosphaerae]|uniref:Phage tail protein C-terminal domain-containing protein n=1 Tax=Ignatzschineria rhizosphaerae TaxID=2923279 RepID=A0ABY3WZB5_9GAMM|nr:hypothetical protein [Ignatzschineria rhizosphaerae]UNM95967.1 hypothetical protein MMG00_12300 [Ignatzschineria rhizosphaerae]